MKVSLILKLIVIICTSFAWGCSGYRISADDRYEGFSNNRLRVYVHFSFHTEQIQDESQEDMSDEQLLMRLAVKRANMLVAAASTVKRNSVLIEQSQGIFIYKKCTDEKCEAFVDFPLK